MFLYYVILEDHVEVSIGLTVAGGGLQRRYDDLQGVQIAATRKYLHFTIVV